MKKESLKRKITLNKKVVLLLTGSSSRLVGGTILGKTTIFANDDNSVGPCDTKTRLIMTCTCPPPPPSKGAKAC